MPSTEETSPATSRLIRCPKCNATLRLLEGAVATRLRCAACGNGFAAESAQESAPRRAESARAASVATTPMLDVVVEPPVTLRDYFAVIRRRFWALVTMFLAAVITTAVYTFSQEPTYRAVTTLIVEPDIPELAGIGESGSRVALREFYETQWGIIRSDKVLRRVFDGLELAKDPEFATAADPIRALRGHLVVSPVPDSRLVRLALDHGSREAAMRLADVLADSYIQYTLEDRRAASRNTFEWLSQQISGLKDKVEASERALLEFRDTEEVVSLTRRQELLEERLAGLSDSHNQSGAKTLELRTILAEVEKLRKNPELVESMPRILENSLVQKLKQELSELSVELARVASKYKPKHPEIVGLESQITAIKERLSTEVDKIYRSLEIEYRLALGKEGSIKSSLEEAKRETMKVAEQSIRYRVLEREANSNRQIYDVLLQRLREADISGNISGQNIRVLDRATAALEPYKPRVSLNLLIAAAAGLLAGVGLCFLVEHVDNTLKSDEDVTQMLRERVLGLIPRQKGKLETVDQVSDQLHSAYANIRTTLRLHAKEHVLKSILITSAMRGEGKTLSSICLATAFARSGLRVLLIDADMYQASVAKRLKIDQGQGLSDFFLQGLTLDEVVRPCGVERLDVVPAGLIPPNPGELLGTSRMVALLEEAKRRYDFVIFDTPPMAAALDVALLGSIVDGVIVAARANKTPRPLAKRVLAQLRSARCNVLGVMLTAVSEGQSGSGYYYYRYGESKG